MLVCRFVLLLFSVSAFAQPNVSPWHPIGRLDHEPIRESSGFVTSRQYEDVYWTLNDSGNPNVLYATRLDGTLIREFLVQGANNSDWEALAVDDKGQLWVGEIGNISRARTDLRVYVVPEPDPFQDTIATVTAIYPYKYPAENVDAEGMFIYEGMPYIISKEVERAVLYRFTKLDADTTLVHVLGRVGELSGGAFRITGASLSDDGTRLAACTYTGLWVYHADKKMSPAELIKTEPWSLTHDMSVEAAGFKGDDLILTNERRDIFKLSPWWYEQGLDLPPRDIQSIFKHEEDIYPDLAEMETQSYRDMGVLIDGCQVVLLAEDMDARLTWPLDIPRSDRYTFSAILTRGPEYGRVQLYVDGQPAGEPQDLYAEKTAVGSWVPLGVPSVTRGYHELTLYVVGKSEQSAGYKVGIDSYHLQPASPFAKQFHLIGPFDKKNPDDIDTPLPPEKDPDLADSFTGIGGKKITWKPTETRDDALLRIGEAFPEAPRYAVAYALTYAYSKNARLADLLVGSDDQVAVWVNGKEVHRNNVGRGAFPDSDIVPCELNAGWNKVLCKIGQSGGGWGLFLRFNDPDGSLKYGLKAEE
ncbi:MAG: hypothetical protein HN521_24290 [Candidatus Latescibacteria bacterium]|nr:hypothetical protein [Candidatus Latescibacterota bacterium]